MISIDEDRRRRNKLLAYYQQLKLPSDNATSGNIDNSKNLNAVGKSDGRTFTQMSTSKTESDSGNSSIASKEDFLRQNAVNGVMKSKKSKPKFSENI